MRLSIAAHALAGAAAVSAAAVKRETLVPFEHKFNAMSLDDFVQKFGNATELSSTESSSSISSTSSPTTVQAAAGDNDGGFSTSAVCPNPIVRVEWRRLSDADKTAFVNAITCLMDAPPQGIAPPATNRYEEIVWVHQQMTPEIHQTGIFLPWHRYYLWTFSRIMREECGFAAPLPWWHESQDAGNFAASGIFTDNWLGALPPLNNGQGTCITNGAFANRPLHIGPGSSNTERCLSRGENTAATGNVNQGFVDQCTNTAGYDAMEQCNELGPHGNGHNGIGPVMAEVAASPGDPAFFLHHSFVDWMWNRWQRVDGARLTDVGSSMTMDTVLSSRGLRPDVTVGQMMDIRSEPLCYAYDG